MKPSEALSLHREDILRIAAKYHTKNPRVFGSVLRGQDTEESDLDLLVDPIKGTTTLLDIGAIRYELKNLLGIQVDVLTPKALPVKFRDTIIAEARPL